MEQPIRILQRPTNAVAEKSEDKSAAVLPTKTREQREAEYAAARLRILGSEIPKEEKLDQTCSKILKPDIPLEPLATDSVSENSLLDNEDQKAETQEDPQKAKNSNQDSNEKKSSNKKKLPPSLMSIKTAPICLDPLSEFKVLAQPLLSSNPSQQVASKNGKKMNARNNQNIGLNLPVGNLRTNRHSDTSLYSRNCSLPGSPPQQPMSFQQQAPLLISNWDASHCAPQYYPNLMGGKPIPLNQPPTPVNSICNQPGTTDANLLAAMLTAAATVSGPQMSNLNTNNSGLMPLSTNLNLPPLSLLDQKNHGQPLGSVGNNAGKDAMAYWNLGNANGPNLNSTNGLMRPIHSQPNFNFQQAHQVNSMAYPNLIPLQNTNQQQQISSGHDGQISSTPTNAFDSLNSGNFVNGSNLMPSNNFGNGVFRDQCYSATKRFTN